jgi:hypothetical protein
VIRPGTVLPEATIVPSRSIWEGNPGQHSLHISPLGEVGTNSFRSSRGHAAGDISGDRRGEVQEFLSALQALPMTSKQNSTIPRIAQHTHYLST